VWIVRGAVWFGFETKSHLNRKIKKHIKSESKQTKPMWFELDRLVPFLLLTIQFFVSNIKKLKHNILLAMFPTIFLISSNIKISFSLNNIDQIKNVDKK